MSFSRIALACAASCTLAAGSAAASWRPVPGAPEVEIQLGSMQLERTRVVVWLRWWGRHPLVPEPAVPGARQARVHRTALRTEFDCSQRTTRMLAANAYDGAGAALSMASTAGPLRRWRAATWAGPTTRCAKRRAPRGGSEATAGRRCAQGAETSW